MQRKAYACVWHTAMKSSAAWNSLRHFSKPSAGPKAKSNMQCWQVHNYGGIDQMTLCSTARVPQLKKPDDVLVEIHAASINPIDTLLLDGYGASTWKRLRRLRKTDESEFPLILGRDFSGEVVSVGKGVQNFKPGDEVWGAVDAFRQGTHAEFAVLPNTHLMKKPNNLSHIDASSIPYVSLTAWSALCTVGGLSAKKTPGKRVLVLGGSGGIGTFAIQLLKAWGAEVTTTCSTEASELVTSLGADTIIDYKTTDAQQALLALPRFDVVLDAVGGAPSSSHPMELLKNDGSATYTTIVAPLLKNFDQSGLLLGGIRSALSLGGDLLMGLKQKKHYRWAFFLPNKKALQTVTSLVEGQKIVPVVEKVFPFSEVPQAFDKVMAKRNRGKTVIDVKG